jgi:3-oxoacyl-[acyl-carrier-protein] synthase-3
MIGIKSIDYYIPEKNISNHERKDTFNISDDFIDTKIGVAKVSRIESGSDTSDLCAAAYDMFLNNQTTFNPEDLDIVIVCTQNPDFNLPHTSAILHGRFDLPSSCAAFDLSLGCSGYVYGLSIIESFMKSSNMKHGLLFTADPYSKIIDENDKNTALLFGDAASVTYISNDPVYTNGKFTFGTKGAGYEHLICRNGKLHMNGREIFNFAARTVPNDIKEVLKLNHLEINEIDRFLFHQGSKFIIDFLIKRVGLDKNKTPYAIKNYGNTVSSSIPIMLKGCIDDYSIKKILISGFGVGLSWASGILTRNESFKGVGHK